MKLNNNETPPGGVLVTKFVYLKNGLWQAAHNLGASHEPFTK